MIYKELVNEKIIDRILNAGIVLNIRVDSFVFHVIIIFVHKNV